MSPYETRSKARSQIMNQTSPRRQHPTIISSKAREVRREGTRPGVVTLEYILEPTSAIYHETFSPKGTTPEDNDCKNIVI